MSNDLIQAAAAQDASSFQRILDGGWKPPKIKYKNAGYTSDFAVWTEVVLQDWLEGLMMLDHVFPEITRRKDVLDIALKNMSLSCTRYLLPLHNFSAHDLPQDKRTMLIQHMISSLGQRSASWDNGSSKKVESMVTWFQEQGVFLGDMVYPGNFCYDDFGMIGHSLFTWSLCLEKWSLAHRLWPSSVNNWKNWPRLSETIVHLINAVVGDYRGVFLDANAQFTTQKEQKKLIMRWLQDYGLAWMTTKVPPLFGTYFLNIDTAPPGESKPLFPSMPTTQIVPLQPGPDEVWPCLWEQLSSPTTTKISAWMRLVLALDKEERRIFWKIWEEVLDQDPGVLWLHELASYPEDDDVLAFLGVAKEDNTHALAKYWMHAMPESPSPHERWLALGGDPEKVSWLTSPWLN